MASMARWRASNFEGVTPITRELLNFWASPDRPRRLFFCQLEAVQTVIYLAEILKSGKRPRFNPQFPVADLSRLIDPSPKPEYQVPLTRFGCKMATGSGKTVVMVSHKRGLLAQADKLLVMADGAVQAYGGREEVMRAIGRPRVVAGTQAAAQPTAQAVAN